MVSNHTYLVQLQAISNNIVNTRRVSKKDIFEISENITGIINNSTPLYSFNGTEQIYHAVAKANVVVWTGKYKNKSKKIEKINEIFEVISENVRRGILPDKTADYPDFDERAISSKVKIISRGVGDKTRLDTEITTALSQSLDVVTNAIEMINSNMEQSIYTIEKIVGFNINQTHKKNELVEDVLSKLIRYKALITEHVSAKGGNITTYENNSDVIAIAMVRPLDFHKRIFIGDNFSTLTRLLRVLIILHEFSHQLGSCDFFYLPKSRFALPDEANTIKCLIRYSAITCNNLGIIDLNDSEHSTFLLWSGMGTIEEALQRFHSDEYFRGIITFNNADILALVVMALHYDLISFKGKSM